MRVALPTTLLTTLALTATALTSALPAQASEWRPFKALKIIVSDVVDGDGEVYSTKGHFLVAPSGSEYVYLLTPKAYSVHRIGRDAAGVSSGEPRVDIDDKDAYHDLGVMEKSGGVLKWQDASVRYALSAKPPLLGEVTLEELRDHTKKYEYDIETYEPNRALVTELGRVDEPVEFVVGFGTWCPVCADWLPRFIKTIVAADNEHFTVRYVAVNEDLDTPADTMAKYGLEGVPTFIVRRGGEEIGRITGDELETDPHPVMERVLVDFIIDQ